MIPGLKGSLITGGIGAIAVVALLFMLAFERGSHAKTKQSLADEKSLVADLRSQQATDAADRASDVSEELERMRLQLEAERRNNANLRRDLSAIEAENEADERESEARIERLKRENEKLMAWAIVSVPDEWISFMREPVDQALTAAPPGSSGSQNR